MSRKKFEDLRRDDRDDFAKAARAYQEQIDANAAQVSDLVNR